MEGKSDHWLAVVSESDERLAEWGDSPDPVAQREVADALIAKGRALRKLERFAEAVEVWDELLRRLALESLEGSGRSVLRALLNKAIDLDALGEKSRLRDTADALLALCEPVDQTDQVQQMILSALLLKVGAAWEEDREEVIAIDAEIVRRFAASTDSWIREQVTTALARTGYVLAAEGAYEDAVQIAHAMGSRITDTAGESVIAEAKVADMYARFLLARVGPTGRPAWIETLTFPLVSRIRLIGKAVKQRVGTSRAKWLLRGNSAARGHRIRVTPARWDSWRTRLEAGVDLSKQIIDKMRDEPGLEPQRVAALAQVSAGVGLVFLGEFRQGWRRLSAVLDRSDPAGAQALKTLATSFAGREDLTGRLSALTVLSVRAENLSDGDKQLEQVAYEDSIEPVLSQATNPIVRWLAALLRPSS